jgi:ankyrin repeat protein
MQDRPDETALIAATINNYPDSAALLLNYKADPNRSNAEVKMSSRIYL